MLGRIILFNLVYRHVGARAFIANPWRPGDPIPPTWIANSQDLENTQNWNDLLTTAERARILDSAELAVRNLVEVRGHGQCELRLMRGDWYDYKDTELNRMINRHDFLLPLCQAQLLTGDNRYRRKIEELFGYWSENFSLGRLRSADSPIDAAIRLLNWIWALDFRFFAEDVDTQLKIKRMLYLQLEYIRAWSSAGGNHLVLESLAGFLYGVIFRDFCCGNRWYRWGYRTLTAEIRRQVTADGVHTEQSTFYHHVVTGHFLKAYLTAHRNDIALPADYSARLRKMIRFIHDTTKPDLSHAMLGDGEPMTTNDREHWEAKVLLAAGFVCFKDTVYTPLIDTINDAAIWFLHTPSSSIGCRDQPPTSTVYAESGLVMLRAPERFLLMDAASFGDPQFPHHGHADALSVELGLNGVSLIMDPGGYGYYDDSFREYFRSTRAHNTLRVNGRDQSQIFGVLGYGRLAPVTLENWDLGGAVEKVSAAHYGYSPVEHRREVYQHKEAGFFLILDLLRGPGRHDVEALYHLAPNADVDVTRRVFLLGKNRFPWDCLGTQPIVFSREKGREKPEIQGWYSPSTGERIPVAVLIVRGNVELPFCLATVIWDQGQAGTMTREADRLTIKNDTVQLDLSLDLVHGRSEFFQSGSSCS